MRLITDTAELAEVCGQLRNEPWVTVDTEFQRDRTYWPKLCLLQLGGSEDAVAVDPLAPGLDLAPALELMADRNVVKVFHAARQDVEIFWKLTGEAPQPLFDTQIAAMVCGFGEEVGYETLVNKLARTQLDKSSRFTDWSKRPLSEAQLRYALGDVTHLRVIYQKLRSRIEKAGRLAWVEAEMRALTDVRLFEQPPGQAWRRLKIRSRDPRFLAVVQALAAWRERSAQTRDLPRNRVLRDDILLEVAAHKPRSLEELRGHERVNLDRESARQVVEAVQEALALPEEALPRLPRPAETPRGLGPLMDLLRVLLKLRCEEAEVAQRLVATSSDLEAIALDDEADVAALAGWRRTIFGEQALALKQGRIALTVEKRKPVVIELED